MLIIAKKLKTVTIPIAKPAENPLDKVNKPISVSNKAEPTDKPIIPKSRLFDLGFFAGSFTSPTVIVACEAMGLVAWLEIFIKSL